MHEMIDLIKSVLGMKKKDPLLELSGTLKISYYRGREELPAFISGMYGGRGVTVDTLDEKGFYDKWHPHTRVVVSLNGPRRETHIVAKKGSFFSRRLGGVWIDHPAFSEKYMILSSNPPRAERLVTKEIADWVLNLKMPFRIDGNQVVYHQDKLIEDTKRIVHVIDALVYIGRLSDNLK